MCLFDLLSWNLFEVIEVNCYKLQLGHSILGMIFQSRTSRIQGRSVCYAKDGVRYMTINTYILEI